MKKWIVLMAALISAFSLAACTQAADSDRLTPAVISDYVTKVDIQHHRGGKSTQWAAKGEDVDNLRDWASKLECELLEYEAGQSPGDCNGGEIYNFTLTEGDDPGFSYVISGPNQCYLLIEGTWYSVLNPSNPPVTEP